MLQVFPVGLRLQGRACLVVGSSEEAEPRVRALLDAGARVRWVTGSRSAPPELAGPPDGDPGPAIPRPAWAPDECLEICWRELELTDVDERWLVVLADRDPELALRLSAACEARRTFYCAIDQPEGSSFFHMALVRAGEVTVAISTAGTAPALGRRLRQELTRLFEEARLGDFAARVAAWRAELDPATRKTTLNAKLREVTLNGKLELPDL